MKRKSQKKRLVILIVALSAVMLCGMAAAGKTMIDYNAAVTAPTPESVPTPCVTLSPPTPEPSATPEADRPPVLLLNGAEELVLPAGIRPYTDPGCVAWDDRDGDLTGQIECVIDVFPYRAGEGSVTYSVTDSAGQTATVTRRVVVTAPGLPATVIPEEKTIYLTFDDGPSANTQRLLDTLDKFGVKATFFVTNAFPEYEPMLAEIARRGHTIGMHSASHDYYEIYQSEEAYFADLLRMQDIIFQYTGTRPTLLRFPGGASNTVSCYNPGIMSTIISDLNDMGYQYFDWNVAAADAAPDANYNTVIANVKKGVPMYDTSVVLMHDTCAFTVDAVPEIIRWAQRSGYTFRPLDPTSFTAHHPVGN